MKKQLVYRSLVGMLVMAAIILMALYAWSTRRPDLQAGQSRSDGTEVAIDLEHDATQSFLSTQNALGEVHILVKQLDRGRAGNAHLDVSILQTSPTQSQVAAITVPLARLQPNTWLSLKFPSQPKSAGRSYLLLIQTNAQPGVVALAASGVDAYPDGELKSDGELSGDDLAFQAYDQLTPPMVGDALRHTWMDLLNLIGFTLYFAVSGGCLLALINSGWHPQGFEYLAAAVATGLAFFPALTFVLALAHMRFGNWLPGAVTGCLVIMVMAVRGIQCIKQRTAFIPQNWIRDWFRRSPLWQTVVMGVLLVLALAVRVIQIEAIFVPFWTDGLAHVEDITRIIAAGGLPPGDVYHLGFHINTVMLYWLTGIPIPKLTLLFGQWVLVMAGLTFYLAARRITGRSLPALISAIGLWFFASLPAYVTNWGRYPFLLGLVILPVAAVATLEAVRRGRPRAYVLAVWLTAGLFLCHYGAAVFEATLLCTFGINYIWDRRKTIRMDLPVLWRRIRKSIWVPGIALAAIGLIGMVRLAPLLQNGKLASLIDQSRQTAQNMSFAGLLKLNFAFSGIWLWAAALLGIIVADFLDRRSLAITGGWVMVQLGLTWLQRPFLGEAVASYANLILLLSLPGALLAGIFVEWIFVQCLPTHCGQPKFSMAALSNGWGLWTGLMLVVIVLAGFPIQAGVVNPDTILFSSADLAADQWVMANSPLGARFLINSYYWGTLDVLPADGGGWLTQMTGRPSVYLKGETTDLNAFLRANRIDYIYVGLRTGFLDPIDCSGMDRLCEQVYDQGGIRIMKVAAGK